MSVLLFKKYFRKYWVLENDTPLPKPMLPMIPDGNLEVLFVTGKGFIIKTDISENTYASGVYMGGQISGFMEMELLPYTRIYILKLQAATLPLISNFHICEITDSVVPLEIINKKLYLTLKDSFFGGDRMKNCVIRFLDYLERNKERPNDANLIQLCAGYLQRPNEDFTTLKKHILQDSKVSSRTLENKYKQYIGLTPKIYTKTIKLRKSVESISYNHFEGTLTELAIERGYYDQSHFIREFKTLFKRSPTQLNFSDYFIPNSKESFRYYTIN